MFVNLVAPINQLGYGVVGFNVMRSLINSGHQVSLFPIGGKASWENNKEAAELIQKAVNNSQFFDTSAPSIRIWHQHDMAMFPGGGKRIGWPIFELDTFSEKEQHHLGSVDSLVVCSEWAKKIIENSTIFEQVDRVDVVPLGVNTHVFYRNQADRDKRPYWSTNNTVFINVGKWEARKGHNELIEAFCKAFTPNDNVELWMMNDNPFINLHNENWKIKYITSSMGSKIRILARKNTQGEMRELFNQVDFGVFPSHAEGWNLEPLELMACGIPSILTNYSGHTEYANNTNSLLIEPNGMEDAHDSIGGHWFHGQGKWCSFEINDLVSRMKEAHEYNQKRNKDDKYRLLSESALATANRFTWGKSASKLLEVI